MTVRWGEKRYYSLDYYLKTTYDEKLYKISLDGHNFAIYKERFDFECKVKSNF